MRNYRNIFLLFLCGTAFVTANCSGSSSGTNGENSGATPQLTTIDDLPQASAPVVSSSSSSLSAVQSEPLFATTGITLKDMDDSSFNSDSSLAMCEAANTLKSSLNEAVSGDITLCYIQNIAFENLDAGIDIYDGNPHIFDLTFVNDVEEEGSPGDDFRIKIQITKDSDGIITDFKMHACEGGEQTEYIHQNISGSAFTMNSIYTYDDDFSTGGQEMTVTGTLNGDGDFTSKTISSSYTGDYGTGTYYGSKTVEQGSDSATISQADAGTWTWSDGQDSEQGTHANQVYAVAELLNTDSIATIAIGDGAATGFASGTCCGGQSYEEPYTQGWDGDTTEENEASDFLDDLENADLPDFPTQPTITFSDDADYDCTGDAIELTVDVAAVMTACEDLELGWEWVNCYDIVQNGNGDDNDGGGGESCSSDSECLSSFGEDAVCAIDGGGGHCSLTCSNNSDCAPMDDNATCQNNVCVVSE